MNCTMNMSGNNNTEKIKACPGLEQISAFFDGELDRNSKEARHIADCAECRRHLDAYDMFHKKLSQEIVGAEDSSLIEKIQSRVHKELVKGKVKTLSYSVLFLKAAVIFLILSGTVLYIAGLVKTKNISSTVSFESEESKVAETPEKKKIEIADIPAEKISPGSAIPFKNFTNVSTGVKDSSLNGIRFSKESEKDKPVYIPDKVHHVWVVKNPEKAYAEIKNFAKELNIAEEFLKFKKTKNGSLQCIVHLTKHQLVTLVRAYEASGFELLDSTAPQPEQSVFYGNANDPAEYSFDIIPEKDF